jgi:formimidoylglutamate deiminase
MESRVAAEQIIEARLTYVDGAFAPGVRVQVDAAGRIAAVGPLPQPPTRRFEGCALLPGFVNAHSHAFQRGLRGLGESYPCGVGSFWTWREAMYALVESLDRAQMRRLCEQAFVEMLACGITTVGEFHYLHHEDAGALDFAFDDVVIEAAAAVGIRLVLLASYYRTGGIGRPLAGGQRRFATPSVARFTEQVDALQRRVEPRAQSVAIAPHSVRAVPPEDFIALCREAEARQLPVHVHLEEQRREVEECVAALGCSPMEWVLDHVPVGPRFTAIHATHATPARLQRWLLAGAGVCLCPITEGNLGDGIADAPAMLAAGGRLCLGTDSNVRLDMLEELRWLEFAQRLRSESRGVFADAAGRLAPRLLESATRCGAAALGVDAGAIEPGRHADFVAIDLEHPSLAGCTAETLLAALILGSGGECVREVCVGGTWRAVRGDR